MLEKFRANVLKTAANMCDQYCDTFLEMEFRLNSYPMHREPSHPFKIKERACFVFLAAMFIFCARGTCGLLVQGLE